MKRIYHGGAAEKSNTKSEILFCVLRVLRDDAYALEFRFTTKNAKGTKEKQNQLVFYSVLFASFVFKLPTTLERSARYSALMFAFRTTAPHFAISSLMY
jgi:hypothetical protein